MNFIGLEGIIETIKKSLIRITCFQLNYSENLKERELLGAPDIDRRIMLVNILNTLDIKGSRGFSCSRPGYTVLSLTKVGEFFLPEIISLQKKTPK
jgi:hypothetical protein